MPIGLSNSVLNQKNAPAIYEDIFANRPAAGFNGRIFISTDTSQIFIDNGSSWVLIANTGIGSTGNLQVVTTNGNTTSAGISITAGGLATNAAQITGLTQSGGVLFTDGSGNLQQDTNFNWDNTNNYLGIGQTGTPTAPLDIHNGTVGVQIQLNATSTNNSTIAFQNANVGKWRVGNLYSSGSNLFHIYNNTAANNALTIDASNAATFIGSVTATSHITSGGTSSQFVKGNGTLDSTTYVSLTAISGTSPIQYNNTTGVISILQSNTSQSGYLSSTDWNTFNNKASLTAFSATTPLSYNNSTGAFSIQVANTGQSGYLTNTDWNTFNGKQSALSFGNLTETSSSVLTIAGGTSAVIGSGTTIAVKQSNSTQSGYLSSTDWTTFNNKQSQINGTGFVKASGTAIIYDNSTYYLASNPSGYITLSSLTSTTPITYNNGTGNISIAQSGTSSSGYLSSTDWNTFNSKASLTAFSASPPLSYNSSTGAFSITQSSGSTNGYLSSTDWTTFNNKQSALTNPITGTGTSGYVPKFNGSTTLTNSLIYDNGTLIGVNTASPTQVLTINGNAAVGGQQAFWLRDDDGFSSNAARRAWAITANYAVFGTLSIYGASSAASNPLSGTPFFNITSAGNVGIGTTSPSNTAGFSRQVQIEGTYPALTLKNVTDVAGWYSLGAGSNGDFGIWNNTTSSYPFFIPSSNNVLIGNTTDNGQGKLQNTGQSFTGGLGIGGLTFSTNTTASVNTSFYFFNGGAGVSLTMPDTNGQSNIYYIKNYSANALTIARTGTNTFIAAGAITSVTSLTLAAGASATLIGNGTTNYIQIL